MVQPKLGSQRSFLASASPCTQSMPRTEAHTLVSSSAKAGSHHLATTAYRIPHKCLEVTGYVLAGGRILWLDPRADARGNHGSLDDAHAIRSGQGAPRAACSTWNPEHIESETSFCTRPAYSASRSKYANPCRCRAGGRTCAAFRAACSGSTASTADGQMSLACQSLRHVLMTMRSH